MPASEAQVRANQQNAQKSTGPKTPEGKEKSRANALKHGLTGDGVVMPAQMAAEVDRRYQTYASELRPTGALGMMMVHRAATLSVRMEACNSLETNAVIIAVRQAIQDCETSEEADDAEITAQLIAAAKRAMLDPSQEVLNIRKYEAAAERGFYRALKELRQVERSAKAISKASTDELMAKILGSSAEEEALEAKLSAMEKKLGLPPVNMPSRPSNQADFEALRARVDVPITIGKRR